MNKTYADNCLERAEKATKGPWHIGHINEDFSYFMDVDSPEGRIAEEVHDTEAYFIVAARTSVPELARRLKRACSIIRHQGVHHVQEKEGQFLINEADRLEAMPDV